MANAAFTTTPSGCQKGSDTVTNREENRKNSVTVPMTAEQKEAVREAAKKEGMTMATFIRHKIIKTIMEEK